jgi:hypothetical protein
MNEAPAPNCRYCDDTGEFYGNLGIRCKCQRGEDRTDLPHDLPQPVRSAHD